MKVLPITQGKWRIRRNGTMSGRWLEIVGDNDSYYQGGGPFVVAQSGTVEVERNAPARWVFTDDAEETRANMTLMRAAPEMYKALTIADDLALFAFAVASHDRARITEICDKYQELHQDMTEAQAFAILRAMERVSRAQALEAAHFALIEVGDD